jgi:integrase
MSIHKVDANKYLVKWKDSEGKSRSKTVWSKKDAEWLNMEIKRKKAMGDFLIHEKGIVKLINFWDLYWQNYALVHLTPRTRDNYERLWKTHIRPKLGAVPLRAIDKAAVAQMVAGLDLAPASIHKILAVLQGILQRAVEWDFIRINPVVGFKKPKLLGRDGIALTDEHVRNLVDSVQDERSRLIVMTLAATGIRPGELRGLQWNDIKEARLHVVRAISNDEIGPTKTGRKRSVEPLDWWWAEMRDWTEQNVNRSEWVFPGHNRDFWTDQGWRNWRAKVFTPAAKRAGFDGLRPYDLRHTFASQRIAAGTDVLELARQLGHSPTMTLTVYGHQFYERPGVAA